MVFQEYLGNKTGREIVFLEGGCLLGSMVLHRVVHNSTTVSPQLHTRQDGRAGGSRVSNWTLLAAFRGDAAA